MDKPKLYISNVSGICTDTYSASGFGSVLDEILNRTRGRMKEHGVTLHNRGPYHEITYNGPPLTAAELEQCDFFVVPRDTGYYVTGGREKSQPPTDVTSRDVDEMWKLVKQHSARRSALWDEGIRGTELENQLRDKEPPPYWPIVTWIGDGRMQAQGIHNGVLEQWCATREHFTTNLKTLLKLAATPEPDVEAIAAEWGRETGYTQRAARTVTSSQLFNPHQGKGLNQPKANTLKMDNVKDNFWLLEYLKVVGLWMTAAPRSAPDRERKTYVVAPLHMSLHDHKTVFTAFSERLWHQPQRDTTSLKLDITSILLYLDTLLRFSEAAQRDDEIDFGIEFDRDLGPEQVVSGLHVVQYKLLSQQAYTVTHMGFLGLPRWTAGAENSEDVLGLQRVIKEHLRVISGIDETHSDGSDLLRRYRNFVAGDQWSEFFHFAVGYSGYVMRTWNAGQQPWLFSTLSLRRLLMSADKTKKPYSAIVQNGGFQNVAYAIRHSTIVPQGQMARYKQGKGDKPLYEVRYGLGQSLKQKANNESEFLAALGDFASTYSAETYQTYESTQERRRRDLHASDIVAVTELVDDFGPEVVCNLLVAYGYASDFAKEELPTASNNDEQSGTAL